MKYKQIKKHRNLTSNIHFENLPNWFKEAQTVYAEVNLIDNRLHFVNGTWEDGRWKGGTWEYGRWERGIWEYGRWERGIWERGTWEDGLWKDGRWKGGRWKGGTGSITNI